VRGLSISYRTNKPRGAVKECVNECRHGLVLSCLRIRKRFITLLPYLGVTGRPPKPAAPLSQGGHSFGSLVLPALTERC